MKYSEFRQRVCWLPLLSTSQLGTLTYKVDTLRVQLSGWKKKGLVRSLRKGLYVLGPEERHVEPPHFYLANQILVPSYVSLESALAFYGLIPEFVAAATSVTTRKTCRFQNEFGIFTYQHVQPEAYDGFVTITQSGKFSVLLATPEKAIVDFLYLNLSKFKASDPNAFTQSYRFQNGEDLDPKKIGLFSQRFKNKKLVAVTQMFIREICP